MLVSCLSLLGGVVGGVKLLRTFGGGLALFSCHIIEEAEEVEEDEGDAAAWEPPEGCWEKQTAINQSQTPEHP